MCAEDTQKQHKDLHDATCELYVGLFHLRSIGSTKDDVQALIGDLSSRIIAAEQCVLLCERSVLYCGVLALFVALFLALFVSEC